MISELKILLVEANPEDASLVRELLSDNISGAYVESVDCLSRGIAMLERPGQLFDALLLDVSLAGGGDLHDFAHIRATFPYLPIIVLVHDKDEETGMRAVHGGAQDYFTKSQISGLILAKSIRYAIDKKQVEKALNMSEGVLATITANFLGAVYRCKNDSMRTMEYMSESIKGLTGYSPEEFIANCVRTFSSIIVHEDSARVFEELWKALKENRSYSIEYRIKDAYGMIKWIWERGFRIAGTQGEFLEGVITDITDIKESEKAIRESEQKYRNMFENALEGIFRFDYRGNLLAVNPALVRMHNFSSADEMIDYMNNRHFNVFVKEKDRSQYVHALKQKGQVEGFRTEVRKKDKSIIWVSLSARVIKDENGKPIGYEGSAIDITDNKKAEDLLKDSERRYKGLFEHANEAILVVRGSSFIDCNSRTPEVFGYSKEEIIGASPHSLSPSQQPDGEDSKKAIARKVKEAARGSPQLFEWTFLRKGAKPFRAEVNLSNLVLDDDVLVHTIVRDITSRKEAEENLIKVLKELELKNSELERAHEELKGSQQRVIQQEKMASIGQLAAGVAHEINNPVGFIMSNLNTMGKYSERLLRFMEFQTGLAESLGAAVGRSEDIDREIKERKNADKIDYIVSDMSSLVRESLEGTERVKRIVQDLKSFSRIDEKEYKLADINNGLETTINVAWNELKYKSTVIKEYGNIPKTRCNLGQLNQVFMNILVNAAQAIDEHGNIFVGTSSDGHTIVITISDTGRGMHPEVLEKIFEPFFTTKEDTKGTGLGLSIAYDIVKKHRGDIVVSSELGKGTTFTITIPVVEGDQKVKDGRG